MTDKEYLKSYWGEIDKHEKNIYRFIVKRQPELRESLQSEADRYAHRLPNGRLSPEEAGLLRKRIRNRLKASEYSEKVMMYINHTNSKKRIRGDEAFFICLLMDYADYQAEITEVFEESLQKSYNEVNRFTEEEAEAQSPNDESESEPDEKAPSEPAPSPEGATPSEPAPKPEEELPSSPGLDFTFNPNEIMNAFGESYEQMLDMNAINYTRRTTQQAVRDRSNDWEIDFSKPEYRHLLRTARYGLMGVSKYGNLYGVLDRAYLFKLAEARIKALKANGVEKVVFMAIMDNATTEECRGLNGRVFAVSDLVIGRNMPPIYPPPHPCRSAVRPTKYLRS
jgi:phage putative head morphogenesis protein, SPP1 gp7 family